MYTDHLTISEFERLTYITGQPGSDMLFEIEETIVRAEAAEDQLRDLIHGAGRQRGAVDLCEDLRRLLDHLTDQVEAIAAAAGASKKCALKTAILADIASATRARIDMQDTLSAMENLLSTAN